MKKFFLLLFVAIVSSVSTFAANANASASASTNDADLVIKQAIKFEDQSQPITIYYVKQNDVYQVYSETDLSKQSPSKLKKMDSTKVELAKTYKGKCQLTCNSLKEVADLGYTLYGKYGKYVDFNKVKF